MKTPSTWHDAFGAIVRAKGVAAQTGLHTLLRVNEMRLKQQTIGKLPELLKRIAEERKKIEAIDRKS